MPVDRTTAYFSMEIGLEPHIPTYSGGLGVLAGDTIRAAADLEVPMLAVCLLSRKGYFQQGLDPQGRQSERPVRWSPDDYLTRLPERVSVGIEGREVAVGAWSYQELGVGRFEVPVLFLDTDLPENDPKDRPITDCLYGGDERYRLAQEAVLGVAGVRMLRALGYRDIRRFHMNEGHAALLVLELLREEAAASGGRESDAAVVEAVRRRCVFTTHTPVEAGHDKFPMDLVRKTLEPRLLEPHLDGGSGDGASGLITRDGVLNMTYLGFSLSRYINGVAKRHGEVSRQMFGRYVISAITNGVHPATWVATPMAELLDKYIPDWRRDSFALRYAMSIDPGRIVAAHRKSKAALLERVNSGAGQAFDPEALTIGFARRATAYKRAALVLSDPDRLRAISRAAGPVQLIFAGKAHPRDMAGKEVIRKIFATIADLSPDVRAVYLPDYGMDLCRLMVAGCDLWLNTPQAPMEASGTSGMKAALNGVPSLSILDGWWLEGCIEGITGWAIGEDVYGRRNGTARNNNGAGGGAGVGDAEGGADGEPDESGADAESLYDKLERVIIPTFYRRPERYAEVMRQAIALNGSFFNTHRMMHQYITEAYFR